MIVTILLPVSIQDYLSLKYPSSHLSPINDSHDIFFNPFPPKRPAKTFELDRREDNHGATSWLHLCPRPRLGGPHYTYQIHVHLIASCTQRDQSTPNQTRLCLAKGTRRLGPPHPGLLSCMSRGRKTLQLHLAIRLTRKAFRGLSWCNWGRPSGPVRPTEVSGLSKECGNWAVDYSSNINTGSIRKENESLLLSLHYFRT